MKNKSQPFWKTKKMKQMTVEEWELLCDGCGKCCVYQIEDEDSLGSYYQTNVSCRYLDSELSRCTAYGSRQSLVPDCMKITPQNIAQLDWLPSTCAYRRILFNQDLPLWHHLVSEDPMSVHYAGASVNGRCIPDNEAGDLEEHIIIWDDF